MIEIKMFCNLKEETSVFPKNARCEVIIILNDRVFVRVKNKKGGTISEWVPTVQLTNFRCLAWYNGVKAEYEVAKKLAKMGTILFNSTGQDVVRGSFEIQEIKKLINQIRPLSEYFEKKNNP